tara:strand:- start:989 stop:2110 length:1122 start_codon:yes stop_codon:yes gene_type:complete
MIEGFNVRLECNGAMWWHFDSKKQEQLRKKEFLIVKNETRDNNTLYDILDYFENSHKRALETGVKVIIENIYEGHSYKELDYYKDIYHTITKHNLDGKQFFYLSSNLKEENGHSEFIANNPQYAKNTINIISFNMLNTVITHFPYQINDVDLTIVPKKSFCCFNNRLATHRLLLLYKLYCNKNLDKIYASCPQVTEDVLNGVISDYFLDQSTASSFYKTLPLILDHVFDDTVGNSLYSSKPLEIFRNSAAALVTETLHNDYNNTSLFYSEKTFKPMWYGLPTLIVGQKGANRYLKKLGFELYEEIFDYKFDTIDHMPTRIQSIADQVSYINSNNSFNNWKPLVKEKILYNRNVLEKNKFNKKQSQHFYELLLS